MFLIKLTKAEAGVSSQCGVQTLPQPPSSMPSSQLHLHSLLGIVLCCSGSSGYFWFRVGYDYESPEQWLMGWPGSILERVSWMQIWRQRALQPTSSKGPLTGKYLVSIEEEILLHLEDTWSVPCPTRSPTSRPWGPKKSIGKGQRRSSLGWDNKGAVSLNLTL